MRTTSSLRTLCPDLFSKMPSKPLSADGSRAELPGSDLAASICHALAAAGKVLGTLLLACTVAECAAVADRLPADPM